MRLFLIVVLTAAVCYGACLLYIVLFQRWLLYFPNRDERFTALRPWLLEGRLIGFARPVERPRAVWLMLHGNGGQAASRDYVLGRVAPDEAFYVLEYPGYGKRPGDTSRDTIHAAASEAWAHLHALYPDVPLCLLGESLGSGPACWLAGGDRPPAKLILAVPFDRLADVAAEHYWMLPVRWLLRDDWRNSEALARFSGPVHIYAAEQDSTVPNHHARRLAEKLPRCRLTLLPCTHNDWAAQPQVRISLDDNS